jgi:hypothetical protein
LSIREARDLAAAVRLMEASSKATAERSRRVTARRDRERTVDTALTASREALFAPVAQTLAGADVAARICGNAPLGSFFAFGTAQDRSVIVLGRCSGSSPQQAFARAVAARRYLEENLGVLPADECLARAKTDQGVEEVRIAEWSAATPPSSKLLMLTDFETANRAASYAERNRGAATADLLDGIELLLAPDGIFAAIERH